MASSERHAKLVRESMSSELQEGLIKISRGEMIASEAVKLLLGRGLVRFEIVDFSNPTFTLSEFGRLVMQGLPTKVGDK